MGGREGEMRGTGRHDSGEKRSQYLLIVLNNCIAITALRIAVIRIQYIVYE
jgi:hypothetical protein